LLIEKDENGEIGVLGGLFGFLLLGIALIFVGIVVLVVASMVLDSSGSVGGIILIGPIPIFFGAGPNSTWLIIISLILVVLSFALFVLLSRQARKED
jgi:uncharacterized membrane protein